VWCYCADSDPIGGDVGESNPEVEKVGKLMHGGKNGKGDGSCKHQIVDLSSYSLPSIPQTQVYPPPLASRYPPLPSIDEKEPVAVA
jgi:hypothetical protein